MLDAPLVKVRRGHGSYLTREGEESRFAESETVCRLEAGYPEGLRELIRPALASYLQEVGRRCAESEQHAMAAKAYRQAMKYGWASPRLVARWLKAKMKE